MTYTAKAVNALRDRTLWDDRDVQRDTAFDQAERRIRALKSPPAEGGK